MKYLFLGPLYFVLLVPAIHGGDAKDDLKKMAGTWKTVIDEADGKKLPKELVEKLAGKLIVEGDKYKVYFGDNLADEGAIKLDASKSPKQIDAVPSKDKKLGALQGIYKIEGDEMTVCFAKPGGERPAEFKTKEGTGQMLIGYKRVKK